MRLVQSDIVGVKVLIPNIFEDERGFFYESYSKKSLLAVGIHDDFVQDNHSKSSVGVIRGMHFNKLGTQAKLVRCVSGRIMDVIFDIRPGSSTYKKWEIFELSEQNKQILYVPAGCAHGFSVPDKTSEVLYKSSTLYDPQNEIGFNPLDPELAIQWGVAPAAMIINEKDRCAPEFARLK